MVQWFWVMIVSARGDPARENLCESRSCWRRGGFCIDKQMDMAYNMLNKRAES